jgi:hypothetical protein
VSGDWKIKKLSDGRTVEFLDARWEPDDGTEPPGTIRVRVDYLLASEAGSRVVLLTSEQIEEGARHG